MNYNNKVVSKFSDAIIYALVTTISVFIVILKVAKTNPKSRRLKYISDRRFSVYFHSK